MPLKKLLSTHSLTAKTLSASTTASCVVFQVRQKQAAIRTLEEEREQCLDVERRLQTKMRCGRRAVAAAAGTDDCGGSDDGGTMLSERPARRRQACLSDSEREVS